MESRKRRNPNKALVSVYTLLVNDLALVRDSLCQGYYFYITEMSPTKNNRKLINISTSYIQIGKKAKTTDNVSSAVMPNEIDHLLTKD